MTMAGGLQAIWLGIPDELKASLPKKAGEFVAWATLAVALWGLGGKAIDQTPKE